jgi:prepilin-type N-terminal cleavage/methylation domain-containing protein
MGYRFSRCRYSFDYVMVCNDVRSRSATRQDVKEKGFTLVELAMVVTIIALLLAGILKGQSLIGGAKAKDVISVISDLRIACAQFRDRYKYLPGDWPFTAGEIQGLSAGTTVGTNGDGSIDGAIASTGAAETGSEVAELPLQLYQAGLIGKLNASDAQRRIITSFGAVHVVSRVTANSLVPDFSGANPSARNAIVVSNLPCDIASEADAAIDDGNVSKGRVLGTTCTNGIVQWLAAAL